MQIPAEKHLFQLMFYAKWKRTDVQTGKDTHENIGTNHRREKA